MTILSTENRNSDIHFFSSDQFSLAANYLYNFEDLSLDNIPIRRYRELP